MSDTTAVQATQGSPRVAGPGRSSRLGARGFAILLGATLLLLTALPGPAAAEPTPLDARVVWVRGAHAYVAARDSLALPPFSRLTFTLKSNPVATAEVERTVDGAMVVTRITSGSLAGVKHLDRLRVIAETPDRPRLLRIGLPSATRARLFYGCDSIGIAVPGGFVLAGDASSLSLIRRPDTPACELWPDTVIIRTFDDATDREIAFERGEVDVAMFWPLELSSSRMRDHPRWKALTWPIERGLVVGGLTEGRILCRPEFLPYLRGLGPGALASLLRCTERRP